MRKKQEDKLRELEQMYECQEKEFGKRNKKKRQMDFQKRLKEHEMQRKRDSAERHKQRELKKIREEEERRAKCEVKSHQ